MKAKPRRASVLRWSVLFGVLAAGYLACSPPADPGVVTRFVVGEWEAEEFELEHGPQGMTLLHTADGVVAVALSGGFNFLGGPGSAEDPGEESSFGAVVAVDLDDDGVEELVVAGTHRVEVWSADDGGKYRVAEVVSLGNGDFLGSSSIVADDIDGDDRPDIVLTFGFDNLWFGHNRGQLRLDGRLIATARAGELATGDVDGDGLPEVLASNGVIVTFDEDLAVTVAEDQWSGEYIGVGDVDGTERVEVVTASIPDHEGGCFGDLAAYEVFEGEAVLLGEHASCGALALGDVDADAPGEEMILVQQEQIIVMSFAGGAFEELDVVDISLPGPYPARVEYDAGDLWVLGTRPWESEGCY